MQKKWVDYESEISDSSIEDSLPVKINRNRPSLPGPSRTSISFPVQPYRQLPSTPPGHENERHAEHHFNPMVFSSNDRNAEPQENNSSPDNDNDNHIPEGERSTVNDDEPHQVSGEEPVVQDQGYNDFVSYRAIIMTLFLFRPCVRASVRPSIRPSVRKYACMHACMHAYVYI